MKNKKFLCILLILTLCFSPVMSFYVEASENETEVNASLADKLGNSIGQFIMKTMIAPLNFATDFSESLLTGLDTVLASNMSDWLDKGYVKPSTDGLELMPQSLQVVNEYLQKYVRDYDGYYLIIPEKDIKDIPVDSIVARYDYSYEQQQRLKSYFLNCNVTQVSTYSKYLTYSADTLFYIDTSSATTYTNILTYSLENNNNPKILNEISNGRGGSGYPYFTENFTSSLYTISDQNNPESGGFTLFTLASNSFGVPFKVFKSKFALTKYASVGRSYLPQLPETVIIPQKYIDNPTLLPDITYNIDKSNKTEEVIQNEYNSIINNYITNISGSSGGDSGGDSGGGSGGGSGGSGDSGGGSISDTELFDFLTKLWNESDKKFDKMIDLLETNNKYQKKLVDSLNDIKAILVTQTVFDAFKNRSSETANKAKEKFPTSIPWDVAMILNAMSAEPQELKFSLPIQVKSFGINESIEIDLSSEEWAKLAKTCRYLLSITFILILIQLTRKLFSSGGDD